MITFLLNSFGYNFRKEKLSNVFLIFGNKIALNLGFMWYFSGYIDSVLMVSLELSSIIFSEWICYNLLGNFLKGAIMGNLESLKQKLHSIF